MFNLMLLIVLSLLIAGIIGVIVLVIFEIRKQNRS